MKLNYAKTLFGYDLDKSLNDFEQIASNLKSEGQESSSNAMLYLIYRCQLAEQELLDLKLKLEER